MKTLAVTKKQRKIKANKKKLQRILKENEDERHFQKEISWSMRNEGR